MRRFNAWQRCLLVLGRIDSTLAYLINCEAACQSHAMYNPVIIVLFVVNGFAGAAMGSLTPHLAFRFRSTTETLRVRFRATAGPGLFGAMSTFPRGNVPLPVYEISRNEDGSSTRSHTALVSAQPAVSPVVDDFAVEPYAIVSLNFINRGSLVDCHWSMQPARFLFPDV